MIMENQDRTKYNAYQINELEQYSRKNSLRIYGVDDTTKDETAQDTKKKMMPGYSARTQTNL